MHIQLKLVYMNDDGLEVTQYQDGNARLLAHLTLDGLDIVLAPFHDGTDGNDEQKHSHSHTHDHDQGHKKNKQTGTPITTKTNTKPSPMAWRAYMQAAIDSLKLSIDINDLSIRIHSHSHTDSSIESNSNPYLCNPYPYTSSFSFISIHVDSISLQEQTPMQQKVEIDTLTIMVGQEHVHTSSSNASDGAGASANPSNYASMEPPMEVFRTDGITTILSTRIHEHSTKYNNNNNKMEQLWDIQVNPTINVGMNFISMERMRQVVQAIFSSSSFRHGHDHDRGTSSQRNSLGQNDNDWDGSEEGSKGSSCMSGSMNMQQYDEEVEIGLLANIIQKQGDGDGDDEGGYEYMDNLRRRRNQVRNRVMGVDDLVSEEDGEDEDGRIDHFHGNGNGNDNGNAHSTTEAMDRDEVEDLFHSIDEDFVHYRSALEASINSELGGEGRRNGEGNCAGTESTLTRIRFQMKDATVQVYLTSADERMELDEYSYESISLRIAGVDASLVSSSAFRKVSFDIVDFHIDHLPSCGDDDASQESIPILQCYSEVCSNDDSDLDGVGERKLVSLTVDTELIGEDASRTNANVTILPLQVVYLDSVITRVAMGFAGIATNLQCHGKSECANKVGSRPSPLVNFNCRVICGGILAILPLHYDDDTRPSYEVLEAVFRRSGYNIVPPANQLGPAIICEVSSLSIFFDRVGCLDEHVNDQEDMQVNVSVHSCVVSFICPIPESHDESSYGESTRKFDIMALESEDKIDPDATVKIRFCRTDLGGKAEPYKKRRAKVQFPMVTPLASVKASQQCDYPEQKGQSEHENAPNDDKRKTRLRGSDPQLAMLKDLTDCETKIEIHVPSLLLDLSAQEKDALSIIMTSGSFSKKQGCDTHSENVEEELVASSSLNIVVNCDQCSFSIHQVDETNSIGGEDSNFCYILICDGFKSHFLLDNGHLKNMRLLFHDITLYEGKTVIAGSRRIIGASSPSKHVLHIGILQHTRFGIEDADPSSFEQMCQSLRKRRTAGVTSSSAIFFRSKLSHPLSMITPLLLVDILVQRNGDHVERGVHISCYDLTHRYDCKAKWINQLLALKRTNETTSNKGIVEDVENSTIDNVSD